MLCEWWPSLRHIRDDPHGFVCGMSVCLRRAAWLSGDLRTAPEQVAIVSRARQG